MTADGVPVPLFGGLQVARSRCVDNTPNSSLHLVQNSAFLRIAICWFSGEGNLRRVTSNQLQVQISAKSDTSGFISIACTLLSCDQSDR